MAFAKSVAILAIVAAVSVVYFAQESSAQAQSIIVGDCKKLNDCLNNPNYVNKCLNIGPLCCAGKLAGEAGPDPDLGVVAIVEGKCTCCSNPRGQVCKIGNGTANTVNPPTSTTAEYEQCTTPK